VLPACAAALLAACAGNPDRRTLAELHDVEPDMAEVQIEDGLDRAMLAYRGFLAEAPKSQLTPEAMRRLADLQLEKEYGILGDGELGALPAPQAREATGDVPAKAAAGAGNGTIPSHGETEADFERRATATDTAADATADAAKGDRTNDLELPEGEQVDWSGPEEAIELYDQILAAYPHYEHNDQVLYQKARAYDELGRNDEAIAVIERLVAQYPSSRYVDEVQFRRGEYFFMRRKYLDAEESYAAVTAMGVASQYYELALYKLGWTFYKQELHEEALQQYIALLDYKVSTGYDFDRAQDQDEERRVADTYRVVSLSFSALGGHEAVTAYFAAKGQRSYEARIYRQLGEFYLEKLRYHDAAEAYKAFVSRKPLHRNSPHFSMRIVEIYEAGGFGRLVLESKKEFAASYELRSEYWRHFAIGESPEVLSYLRSNLEDLANHYHALYQEEKVAADRPGHFKEALHWYRAYLESFPDDAETPTIHYRLADLLLEHEDFGEAAREYARTAYDYAEHERSAAAGYAAIYAHRQHQKAALPREEVAIRQEAVNSTLRFVNRFPAHEHAAAVLAAAVEDLYGMSDFELAIATSRRLIEDYPAADLSTRRTAWAAIAHSSFDLARYDEAEDAYGIVVEMTPQDDDSHQKAVDNLAAAIYKQGEQAKQAGDHRTAADHFLRISESAPDSEIRPVAEYEAGAAHIRLEDWAAAAAVLEAFRQSHPDHELQREATKQLAFVYRKEGKISRAAEEYERVAREADEPEMRRAAQLLAGELYEESQLTDRALSVYLAYIEEFPKPLDLAVETRFKTAELYESMQDEAARRSQLQRIVEIDRSAGGGRTERVRYLAARSALSLSERFYHRFQQIELAQPFEKSLQKKQKRLDAALGAFEALVDYEVGEVTAGATFYIAELYLDFSKALMVSERPAGLATSELQDYELVLEEEAFPFEEQAIEIHEKNLELMDSGVYNRWIEKSLGQLAELMPGRYAKFESSSGLIDSIDSYAYRAPSVGPTDTGEIEVDGPPETAEPNAEPEATSEAEAARGPNPGPQMSAG
jgi:tetratricopeptide (TPR) repeat protein